LTRIGDRAKVGASRARALLLTALLASSLLFPARSRADGDEERRVEAGLKIFRALLAADVDLKRKASPDGRLLVVFFFTDDPRSAEEDGKAFGKLELATELAATSDPKFSSFDRRVPAGIFLAQAPSPRALREVVDFGISHHVIVYSPFEGHVESGVLGGLSIEAQVRPYVNLTTLRESKIQVRDFFLKVAKVYR
jgi:hypothetical protein